MKEYDRRMKAISLNLGSMKVENGNYFTQIRIGNQMEVYLKLSFSACKNGSPAVEEVRHHE